MTWWRDGMVALDTEATGIDVETDHIVEICLAVIWPSAARAEDRVTATTALVNPGVPVPDAAAAIHGYTTERLQREGGDPATVLGSYIDDLARLITRGTPLVVMNAPYDLTLLDRNCRRLAVPTLTDRLGDAPLAPVLDPLVLDSHVVPKRRRVSPTQGARQLKTLCEVWGLGWDDDRAHGAEYDCLQAARVVWQILERTPGIGAMSSLELHERQVGWRAEQQASYAAWLAAKGEDLSLTEFARETARLAASRVDRSWPIRHVGTVAGAR